MAIYYVRSTDGSDSDTGLSWALAKATLRTATTGALATASAAGDTIYVSDNHNETMSTATASIALGTAAAPTYIIAVDDTGDPAPPTSLIAAGTYATLSTTGTYSMTFSGNGYYYGIDFQAGLTSTATASILLGQASEVFYLNMESCKFTLASTGGSSRIILGNGASTGSDNSSVHLRNCVFKLGSVTQRIQPLFGTIVVDGCSLDTSGSAPTILFDPGVALVHNIIIKNCDLSYATGSLVNVANACSGIITISNCKLGSGVAITTGTIPGPAGLEVRIENCDSTTTNYRMEHYKYAGSIKTETSKIRSGGATDGTTPISWNMTSLAGAGFTQPLESPPIAIWNETTGSSKTVTLEVAQNSAATALNDNEIWIEVEYCGDTTSPKATVASDRKTTILSTAAAQTTSSVTWNNMTTPTKQSLSVTFTPQRKGYFIARVMLAKPSTTVYVDPYLTVA